MLRVRVFYYSVAKVIYNFNVSPERSFVATLFSLNIPFARPENRDEQNIKKLMLYCTILFLVSRSLDSRMIK